MNPELRALKSLQSCSPNKQEPGIKEDCLSQLHRLCHSLCLGRESQIKLPPRYLLLTVQEGMATRYPDLKRSLPEAQALNRQWPETPAFHRRRRLRATSTRHKEATTVEGSGFRVL